VNISFTGTSGELSPRERVYIAKCLDSLPGAEGWFTGGARGVDTFVHFHLFGTRSGAHTVIVPGAVWSGQIAEGAVRREAPRGGSAAESYMIRNDELVRAADRLVAFPRVAREEKRSGTWATIRRACKAEVPVTVFPLSMA
jgi:hypothetical protein